MEDLSVLSDEELDARLAQSQGGQVAQEAPVTQPIAQTQPQIEAPRDFSSMSDDELDYALETIKKNTPLVYLQSKTDEINNKSPLSFADRWAMSTLTPEECKNTLKQKYSIVEELPNGKLIAGNDKASLFAVDPEGMFNDVMGDIADVGSTITTVAGQTIGALIGGAATGGNPAGIMAGGGAGAGIAESINKLVAKQAGSTQDEAGVATDIATQALFGTVGEGVAIGLGKLAPVIAKNGATAFNAMLKRNPVKSEAAISALSKTLRFASNVPEGATKSVFKYGPEEVFTSFNSNKESIIPITQKIAKDITEHRYELGQEFSAAKAGFGKMLDKPVVPVKGVDEFLADLVENNYLNKDLSLNTIKITDKNDLSIMDKVMKNLGVKNSSRGNSVSWKQAISPNEAIMLKRDLSSGFESLSGNGGRILTKLKDSISTGLENYAVAAKNTRFLQANQRFSEFARAMDNLKAAGFNIEKQTGVASFIDNYFSKNPVMIDAIKQIDALAPNKPILSTIEKYASAQAFASARPDVLRFGFIASMVGFGRAETPEEKMGYLGLAALVGSPAGNKQLLRAGFKLAKGFSLSSSIPKSVSNGYSKKLLTSLISQGMAEQAKNKR